MALKSLESIFSRHYSYIFSFLPIFPIFSVIFAQRSSAQLIWFWTLLNFCNIWNVQRSPYHLFHAFIIIEFRVSLKKKNSSSWSKTCAAFVFVHRSLKEFCSALIFIISSKMHFFHKKWNWQKFLSISLFCLFQCTFDITRAPMEYQKNLPFWCTSNRLYDKLFLLYMNRNILGDSPT